MKENSEKNVIPLLVNRMLEGDFRSAARLMTYVENEIRGHHELMRRVYPYTGKSTIIGITGAGGAGKSTLTGHLVTCFRRQGKSVGVVVVDPTSPFSGGALLGDRIRLQKHFIDPGVFIRSMASRGHLGGLSRATYDVIRIMEAMGLSVIIIETIGAGQDEIEVINIAQTCLLIHTPNMGDGVQIMKAGIMEIGDIHVLNKADLEGAEAYLFDLEENIIRHKSESSGWKPRVVPTVSVTNKTGAIRGIEELITIIDEHQKYLKQSGAIEHVHYKRAEKELETAFKAKITSIVIETLQRTGRHRDYVERISKQCIDPYSIVDEIMQNYLTEFNTSKE